HWGYNVSDVVLLMDETTLPRRMPTRKNMIDAMRWLVKDAQAHDSLFFHYSGRGGQIQDKEGVSPNGLNEVIYPVDYKKAGMIADNELHKIMVKELPPGCRLTAVFDSCHSRSTALGMFVLPSLVSSSLYPCLSHRPSISKFLCSSVFSSIALLDTELDATRKTNPQTLMDKVSSADVISFVGCRDNQTIANTKRSQRSNDVVKSMSWALIKSLVNEKSQSYQALLQSVRGLLKETCNQNVQLSSSHPIVRPFAFSLFRFYCDFISCD
ncbi:hypothetical protein CONPUDRAFT_68240, partial [Coniophora puteana RWD-64-598 SS2]